MITKDLIINIGALIIAIIMCYIIIRIVYFPTKTFNMNSEKKVRQMIYILLPLVMVFVGLSFYSILLNV